MLEQPYIKFIYILNFLNKINKKILCFVVEFLLCTTKRVNQQETLAVKAQGSSETTCDITYSFDSYSNLIPEHKKKINTQFLQ
jgi:hypothetical protein